jgi:large subunit ribosomal protein L15e
MHFFFEVILADRASPSVMADKELSFVSVPANRARAYRGITSAGQRARGMRNSPFKVPKVRPSLRANKRTGT